MAFEPLPTSDGRTRPDPATVGASLDRLLGNLGGPTSQTMAGLERRWAEVVGDQVASHTRPVRVRRGTLLVSVDDPAWASELRWMTDEIATRARDVLGDASITRIEVRVDPGDGGQGR